MANKPAGPKDPKDPKDLKDLKDLKAPGDLDGSLLTNGTSVGPRAQGGGGGAADASPAQPQKINVAESGPGQASADPMVKTASASTSSSQASLPHIKTTIVTTTTMPGPHSNNPTPTTTTTTSPYGTRSRTRVGGSRPNYAEDKLETDYEHSTTSTTSTPAAPPDRRPDHGKKRPRSLEKKTTITAAVATDRPMTGVSTRRASAIQEQNATNRTPSGPSSTTTTSKHQIPGTSTFSANPPGTATGHGPPPKKRKLAVHEKMASIPIRPGQAAKTNSTSAPSSVTTQKAPLVLAATATATANPHGPSWTNMLTFKECRGVLKQGVLQADDGTTFRVNDHVYLVCEPPGEPYYLARIMEFLHVDNQHHLPIDSVRVNWYYRPRDIQRKVTDTRLVFATMHSDMCPLTALRGKCRIFHRTELDDLDEYRKGKDCFWYEKLFDRYIHRYYDVIPVAQVINVPAHVKRVLDERWRFLVVEVGRGKELTRAVKSCKRCAAYCASHDSVECAVCRSTYHMDCVRPPLLKKPSRGFAWACAPCSRAQERKLEARNTPLMNENSVEDDEEEIVEDDDDDPTLRKRADGGTNAASPDGREPVVLPPATAEQTAHAKLWPYRYLGQHCRVEDALDYDDRIYPRASSSLGARHQATVGPWPGRPVQYVKAAEIKKKYARGAANKKDAKLSKETIAALEADKIAREKRPKWVQDEPVGYLARGEDHDRDDPRCTSTLLFRMPDVDEARRAEGSDVSLDDLVDRYVDEVRLLAPEVEEDSDSTNLLDKALEILYRTRFDPTDALDLVRRLDIRDDLNEPDLTEVEKRSFDEAVAKYGSELRNVTRHVRTQKHADIVRYYYTWKKTDRGREIWGNFEGRRGKKDVVKRVDGSKSLDDVADDQDDSAFDEAKAKRRKKSFECKFCGTKTSPQWRRAPGAAPGATFQADPGSKTNGKDKGQPIRVALCRRCAELWRRYGIQWEDLDEIAKKVAQGGAKAWKRRIDEELHREIAAANGGDPSDVVVVVAAAAAAASSSSGTLVSPSVVNGHHHPAASVVKTSTPEPPKKRHHQQQQQPPPPSSQSSAAPPPSPAQPQPKPKSKSKQRKASVDKDSTGPASRGSPMDQGTVTELAKKKGADKSSAVVTPIVPELPKPSLLPCAVCRQLLESPAEEQLLSCKECRMTVHRNCYGVVGELRQPERWMCDTCINDKSPQLSTLYQCVLCPVRFTDHDFVEPVKTVSKKESQRDREREQADRESAVAAADFFRRKQEEMNRPANPREPLKRTAGNNWVHVTCAVWTPEMKFGNAKALEPSEGIGLIPFTRYQQVCKVCKTTEGACVSCHQCHAPVHVACAHQAGYTIGFDITPVKSSRREHVSTVTLGDESGAMAAVVWCKEHTIKTIVHPIHEVGKDPDVNALQLFVRNYKQADLTLTGTIRKANLLNQSTKVLTQVHGLTGGNRRASTTGGSSVISSNSATNLTSVQRPLSGNDVNGEEPTTSTNAATTTTDEGLEEKIPDGMSASVGASARTTEMKCVSCGINVSPKWWDGVAFRSSYLLRGHIPGCSCDPVTKPMLVIGWKNLRSLDQLQHEDACTIKTPPRRSSLGRDVVVFQGSSHLPTKLDVSGYTVDDAGRPFYQCHKCHCTTLRDPSVVANVEVANAPLGPGLDSNIGTNTGKDVDLRLPDEMIGWSRPMTSSSEINGHTSEGHESSRMGQNLNGSMSAVGGIMVNHNNNNNGPLTPAFHPVEAGPQQQHQGPSSLLLARQSYLDRPGPNGRESHHHHHHPANLPLLIAPSAPSTPLLTHPWLPSGSGDANIIDEASPIPSTGTAGVQYSWVRKHPLKLTRVLDPSARHQSSSSSAPFLAGPSTVINSPSSASAGFTNRVMVLDNMPTTPRAVVFSGDSNGEGSICGGSNGGGSSNGGVESALGGGTSLSNQADRRDGPGPGPGHGNGHGTGTGTGRPTDGGASASPSLRNLLS